MLHSDISVYVRHVSKNKEFLNFHLWDNVYVQVPLWDHGVREVSLSGQCVRGVSCENKAYIASLWD